MDSKFKPSTVKKNKDIKVDPQVSSLDYDDHRDITLKMHSDAEMTHNELSSLISEINRLSVEDHLNIYILLRKQGIDKAFFSRSKKATHFDIAKLSNELKWRLQMYVKFTQENNSRNKQVQTADQHCKELISQLNHRLEHSQQIDIEDNLPQQSETDKYERMLRLNGRQP